MTTYSSHWDRDDGVADASDEDADAADSEFATGSDTAIEPAYNHQQFNSGVMYPCRPRGDFI